MGKQKVRKFSPKTAAEKMRQIDDEYGADDLLCSILESLGYKQVVKIYKSMKKWYA